MKKKRCSHDYRSLNCQFLRKMKLTILLLLVGIITGWATETYSQSSKLTLNFNNSRIENVLRQIEDQSEYRFFYNGKIDVDRLINLNFDQKSVSEVLTTIFSGTDVKYTISGRMIVLFNGDASREQNISGSQQAKVVSGQVTNDKGEPIPGVSVVIKGTTIGTITSADGRYSLNAKTGDILSFSFVGMKTFEIKYTGQSSLNAKLEEESIGIEEVVAIGYGTVKKSDLTG